MGVDRAGRAIAAVTAGIVVLLAFEPALGAPERWRTEWPKTDFSKTSVRFEDIVSGGPPRDGIPAIDKPSFTDLAAARDIPAREPVISVAIGGEARAYPLRIMIWHEIVNDELGGVPIAVTWCPLCNSAVVFDRRIDGRALSFGTTGKLRNSDLVMYDRETESWWQQFLGEAIVGELKGRELRAIPSRVEALERFGQRFPGGRILAPPAGSRRAYGTNPYAGYDRSSRPFLYHGDYADVVPPLARVIVVDREAWALDLLMKARRIEAGDLVLTWEPGQASALDSATIEAGRDIGNVVVQRRSAAGLTDVVYDVSFAFAFRAFHPDGPLHAE